ncbi:MAG: PrsW family glutamic-type intramembrane protease [Thermomicrobiales bacterium]
MNRSVQRALSGLIIGLGLLTSLGYALAIALASNRTDAADQWGTFAGFGLFAAVAGAFWLLSTFRGPDAEPATTRLPPVWLSFVAFILLVAAGFGLDYAGRAVFVGPLLAILAFVAVGAFFAGIAVSWMPAKRLQLRSFVLPGVWGAFIAPVILILVQGGAVMVIFASIFAGIYAGEPDLVIDPDLGERISSYVEESGTEATTTSLPDIVEAPTVALSLFSVVAVIAPISEELVKAAGAVILLSRRSVVTRTDAFLAAVGSGLGFALFEGVGYTLAATSSWHQLILFRAPVVIMHVAATTIVVLGWYRWRETGRGFIPYFLAGTALHAGWNGLYVGFIYSLTGIESGSDPSGTQALGIAAMVLLLGALFIAAVVWYVSAAHKAGRNEAGLQHAQLATDHMQSPSNAIP